MWFALTASGYRTTVLNITDIGVDGCRGASYPDIVGIAVVDNCVARDGILVRMCIDSIYGI